MPERKIIRSKEEALDFLRQVFRDNKKILRQSRIGLAGSFVRDGQRLDSDIDIVIEPSDTSQAYTFLLYQTLSTYMENHLETGYDLVWLNLLAEQDKEEDQLLSEYGIPADNTSPYKMIVKEVEWVA